MVMTAIDFEWADRDAVKARHAAKIPAICKMLPRAIESRAKTLRTVFAAGSTDPAFMSTSHPSVPANSTAWQQRHWGPGLALLRDLASSTTPSNPPKVLCCNAEFASPV